MDPSFVFAKYLNYPGLQGGMMKKVITVFLRYKSRILVLKRSDKVGSFPGYWAGVSGYIEKGESPYEAAVREIREETGIRGPTPVRGGKPFIVTDKGRGWLVHPFIFDSPTSEITLDWEHRGYRWIDAEELESLETVPGLKKALKRCMEERQ
jgi:8-oxo-dGTP pyrophosphatase MutT (NUDIX family)